MTRPLPLPDPMFGWIFYSVLVGFLIWASVVDYRSLRIPKSLTLSCLIVGVLFNLGRGMWLGNQDTVVWRIGTPGPWLGALDGFLFSLAGFAAAFGLFFALWFLQIAGGGDVKLFAAVGTWVGPWWALMLLFGSVVMIVIITTGMILRSMLSSGFSEAHQAFSHQNQKSGSRRKKRGPTYATSLAIATAVIMLIVLSRDLGLVSVNQVP